MLLVSITRLKQKQTSQSNIKRGKISPFFYAKRCIKGVEMTLIEYSEAER